MPVKRPRSVVCGGPSCKVRFTPKRSTARYHAPACRVAAQRTRTAASKAAKPTPKKAVAPKRIEAEQTSTKAADNHKLVVALRQELETADALDSFEGQLALELARRLVTPGENASALADKVRAAKAAALGSTAGGAAAGAQPAADEPGEDDDEVTKARNARAQARQAAGLA